MKSNDDQDQINQMLIALWKVSLFLDKKLKCQQNIINI